MKTSPRKSRVELIAQLLIQTIFGVWWLVGLHYNHLIFGPGSALITFGPIWIELFPLFVFMLVVDVSFTATMLFRPHWTEGARFSRLVMSLLGLALLFFLIRSPDLFVAANSSPGAQSLAGTVNQAAHLGMLIAVIVNIINIAIATVAPGRGQAQQCPQCSSLVFPTSRAAHSVPRALSLLIYFREHPGGPPLLSRRLFLERTALIAGMGLMHRSLSALGMPQASQSPTVSPEFLDRARTLLRQAPFIDTHNDLPSLLLEAKADLTKFDLSKNAVHALRRHPTPS